MNSSDKRRYQRNACDFPIELTLTRGEVLLDATIHNISEKGVYFETGFSIPPGTELTMWFTEPNPECELQPDITCAFFLVVKWERKLDASEGEGYGIGAEVLDPIYFYKKKQ